jgi:AcrR family transcriptional regulator
VQAFDRPRPHLRSSDAELAILSATERLLARKSLADVTVADIMDEAGVARGTFYHYFASKYSVVIALMGHVRDELFDSFSSDLDRGDPGAPESTLRASLDSVIRRWASHRSVLRAVSENWQAVPELRSIWLSMFERFAGSVAERLDEERASGRAPLGADSREIAAALVYASERLMYVSGLGADEDFPDEAAMADYVVEWWIGGLYGTRAATAPTSDGGGIVARPVAGLVPPPAGTNQHAVLAVAERMLRDTSMIELSARQFYDEAGIGRSTFYRHFGSKFDVLTKLVEIALEDAYEAFDRSGSPANSGPLDRTLEDRLRSMSTVWNQHRAVLRAGSEGWQQTPALRAVWMGIIDRYGADLAPRIDDERASGHAPPGLDSRRLAKALGWATEGCLYIAGLGVDRALPDEATAGAAAARISLGAIYG